MARMLGSSRIIRGALRKCRCCGDHPVLFRLAKRSARHRENALWRREQA